MSEFKDKEQIKDKVGMAVQETLSGMLDPLPSRHKSLLFFRLGWVTEPRSQEDAARFLCLTISTVRRREQEIIKTLGLRVSFKELVQMRRMQY